MAIGIVSLGLFCQQASAAPVRDKFVEAELITEVAAIVPGQRFTIGLRLVADEGWHTYWLNPASPGYITKLKLELPPGFEAGPLQFPYPHRFTTKNYSGGEDYTGYGYEGEAILIVEVTAPQDLAAGGNLTFKGEAGWLMCDPENCVPGGADLELKIPVAAAGSTVPQGPEAEAVRVARDKLPRVPGWKLKASYEGDEVVIQVPVSDSFTLPAAPSASGGDDVHVYPLRHDGLTSLSSDAESVIKPGGKQSFEVADGVLTIRAAKGDNAPAAIPDPFEVVLVSDAGFGDAALGHGLFLSSSDTPVSPVEGTSADDTESASEDGSTAAEGGGEGWGYWLQRPFIVMLLAALMLGLALSLFGVFEFGVSMTSAGGKLANSSGLAGSFFSGALATILATPCTAPFMGPAIAFAIGQPGYVTMAVFTALGFGMVLPYLLLSIFPKAVQKLPRPGPWMETFKQVMGFPMLAVVAWLLWVLTFQIDSSGLLWVYGALLLLALAAWWYGRFASPAAGRSATKVWIARAVALVLLGGMLVVMAKAAERHQPAVERDVEAQIAELQAGGQGVFIDFTAAWCMSCQANKAFSHSKEVEQVMAENDIAFLEVDWTQRDEKTLQVIEKYGGSGVPFYLLFSDDPDEAPIKLKEVFTSNSDIIDVIEDREGAAAAAGEKKELTLLPALVAAMIGGLILNLMPCVFPVISLKIMGFVAQASEDRRTIFRHGLAFSAGAMLFFWILAGSLVFLRSRIGG